jgi:hypothetical protein
MRICALLTGIAALFLATGTAQAQDKTKWPSPNFVADCRRDRLSIYFDKEDYEEVATNLRGGKDGTDENRVGIRIPFEKEARTRLEKALREWRKCDAYYQCLADRDAGKVKHSYDNDKRWRDVYSGEL